MYCIGYLNRHYQYFVLCSAAVFAETSAGQDCRPDSHPPYSGRHVTVPAGAFNGQQRFGSHLLNSVAQKNDQPPAADFMHRSAHGYYCIFIMVVINHLFTKDFYITYALMGIVIAVLYKSTWLSKKYKNIERQFLSNLYRYKENNEDEK